jgi:hypothetical protein
MSRLRYEDPADAPDELDLLDEEEDSRHEPERSDFFELRFCEAPSCDNALPLDKPGAYATIYGQRCLVCPACAESLRDH